MMGCLAFLAIIEFGLAFGSYDKFWAPQPYFSYNYELRYPNYQQNIQRRTYGNLQHLFHLDNRLLQRDSQYDKKASLIYQSDRPKATPNWPQRDLKLGQVTGVAVNSALHPVIFHRADRVWDAESFDSTHHYQQTHLGLIKNHTVLTLDPNTGEVLGKWGADLFLLPHGLTIDKHDNIWLTDVALHQGFKFKPGEISPSLVFGEKLIPGSDSKHLCKPTSFAIAFTGEIFLADGYCNNRILKYNAAGDLIHIIPNREEPLSLQVPHQITLMEDLDRLCIADRENMRVVCPRAGLYSLKGKNDPPLYVQKPDMGKIYGVAAKDNIIYAVNGPTSRLLPIEGLTIDPQSGTVIDRWSPPEGFGLPHALAVCPNGSSLYVVEINPNRVWKFDLGASKK